MQKHFNELKKPCHGSRASIVLTDAHACRLLKGSQPQEHEVYQVVMDTPLEDLDGVGPITMRVFRRAGLHRVADVYAGRGQEELVRQAAHVLATEDGTVDAGHWRALATRCVTVINRVRSAEATPVCPEHFVCQITFVCMEEPCITRYGDTFERWAIERWVDQHGHDPLSRRPLTRGDLFPNKALREAIRYYNAHFLRFSVPYRVRG